MQCRGVWISKLCAAALLAANFVILPARAADLGGNCCADLEERVQNLQAVAAQKGNRKTVLFNVVPNASLKFSKANWSVDASSFGTVTISTGGNPFVVSGTQIAVLDRTAFANEDRAGYALMAGVDNVLAGVLDDAEDDKRSRIWAVALGNYAVLDGGALLKADQSLAGGLAGATFRATPALSLGFFGGGATAEFETDIGTSSIETDYGVAGVYGRYAFSQLVIDFSLTGASSSSDTVRIIANDPNGRVRETAHADYDGWIVSPAIGAGWIMPAADGWLIVPAVHVRGQFNALDGYTETGSSADATVAARDLDHVEGRFEVGFRKDFPDAGFSALTVRAKAGVSVVERFGDRDVDARLLGTAVTFASGMEETETGAYGSIGFDAVLTPGVALFADTEMLLTDQAQSIAGFVGLRSTF